MPPRVLSRDQFDEGITTPSGTTYLGRREPFRFRAFSDNIQHVVRDGDTLWTIAGKYYKGVQRPAGLWWAIADFQPTPILDPTLALEVGSVLIVPSLRTVQSAILSARRARLG